MLLAAARYLTATLDFLLATVLVGHYFIDGASAAREPEEIVGVVWVAACSLTALTASVFLVLPGKLEAGLRWHSRTALSWLMSSIVYNVVSMVCVLRFDGRIASIPWYMWAVFVVCALFWATPGWIVAALARRSQLAAQTR